MPSREPAAAADDAVKATRPARDRRAWIPTVAAVAAVVVFVLAGNWQHRRMREAQAMRAQIEAASAAAPVALPAGVDDWSRWRFREVLVTGSFDAAHQVVIDNELRNERAGYDIVTPLVLQDRRVVLVDRGWVGMGPSRAVLPDPAPPAGVVSLRGRVDLPPERYFELGRRSAASGRLWEHLDPQRIAAATGLPLLPIVVQAVDAEAGEGLLRDWRRPDYGIEMHEGYMMQWYTFAAMAAGLWFWFALRPWLCARVR
jgi:surfeit locus 1 family protein